MTEFIVPSLLNLLDPFNIILMLLGLAGGIIIGALPGLSATMGVALMVPATFAMSPTSGLVMLGAIYVGAIYGGANSAILICTPGTPSSVATTFDGWPLTKRGEADARPVHLFVVFGFRRHCRGFFPPFSGRGLGPLCLTLRRAGKFLALFVWLKHHCRHEPWQHGQRHCFRRYRPAGFHHWA